MMQHGTTRIAGILMPQHMLGVIDAPPQTNGYLASSAN
jgi:hypothetical protein